MKVNLSVEGGTEAIHIESDRYRYVIWPALGGIVNRWQMLHQGRWHDIIHAFHSPEEFQTTLTSRGFPSCKLSPYACRIRNSRYSFNRKEYLIGKFGYDRHNIHGLVYDLPFSVEEIRQEETAVKVVLSCVYHSSDEGYPFPFRLTVTYTCEENGTLTIHTEVRNTGVESMPIVDGWHPYFSLPGVLDDWTLRIDAKECLELDDNLLPTGRRLPYDDYYPGKKTGSEKLDHCFPIAGTREVACTLTDPSGKIRLKARSLLNYPYLQLFIPPARDSLAIEFLSGAPDAFNNGLGLNILHPGKQLEFACSYEVSVKDAGGE